MRQYTWKPGSYDLPGSVEYPGHLIHKDVVDQAGVVHHQHLVHFKKRVKNRGGHKLIHKDTSSAHGTFIKGKHCVWTLT